MATPDDVREQILAAHQALVAEGVLAPLSPDDAETRRWLDCELASLLENRFFEPIDPLAVTPEIRARWEGRATSGEPLSSPHGQLWWRAVYWICHDGVRAGTIGLATVPADGGWVTVSSLYVLPSLRRRGVAGRALGRAQAAVVRAGGAGLRVPTYWTWQPAVGFYLGLGLWIAPFQHSLAFAFRDDLPPWRVEVSGDEACFGILEGGSLAPLLVARRLGETLGWTELPRFVELARGCSSLALVAPRTFAVALAVRGFPLLRSNAARAASFDGGVPEELARKIERYEAWDRKSGYLVRTPRIPGLSYRDWDAID
jgi:GNAT superfamily N-acetyltransferase